MKFEFNKGSRFTAGPQTVSLVEDTVLEVEGVENGDYDHLAQVLSGAHHTLYGAHVSSLAHDETVQRFANVDGKDVLCDIDLAVTYGALGARLEAQKGDPRPVEPSPPVEQVEIGAPRVDAPAASDAGGQQAINAAASPSSAGVEVEPPADELQSDFPGYAALVAAGFTRRSELQGKTMEELEQIKGIVPPVSRQIYVELNGSTATEEETSVPGETTGPPEAPAGAGETTGPPESEATSAPDGETTGTPQTPGETTGPPEGTGQGGS